MRQSFQHQTGPQQSTRCHTCSRRLRCIFDRNNVIVGDAFIAAVYQLRHAVGFAEDFKA